MHVEQHHVGAHARDARDGLGHGPGLADHLDRRLAGELGADAAATVATAGGLVRVVDRFPTLAED